MGSDRIRQACGLAVAMAAAILCSAAPSRTADRLAQGTARTVEAASLTADAQPAPLRGLYLPPGRLAAGVREDEWQSWQRAGIGAIVVDVRDDQGRILIPVLDEQPGGGAGDRDECPPCRLADEARAHGMEPIARIVALRDEAYHPGHPGVFLLAGGQPWVGPRGERWLDPRSDAVRAYLAHLARVAASAGFSEVQLDYVRFPSEGDMDALAVPAPPDRVAAITELVEAVHEALEGTGVILSVALFGQVCSVPGDMGIGQQCEAMSSVADTISPMVYPSHFGRGVYGIPDPERDPARTVSRALEVTARRVETARVRPWLQAFSLRRRYGVTELGAQIAAAERAGTAGWLLWNPSGRYPYLPAAVAMARASLAMVPARDTNHATDQRPR